MRYRVMGQAVVNWTLLGGNRSWPCPQEAEGDTLVSVSATEPSCQASNVSRPKAEGRRESDAEQAPACQNTFLCRFRSSVSRFQS